MGVEIAGANIRIRSTLTAAPRTAENLLLSAVRPAERPSPDDSSALRDRVPHSAQFFASIFAVAGLEVDEMADGEFDRMVVCANLRELTPIVIDCSHRPNPFVADRPADFSLLVGAAFNMIRQFDLSYARQTLCA